MKVNKMSYIQSFFRVTNTRYAGACFFLFLLNIFLPSSFAQPSANLDDLKVAYVHNFLRLSTIEAVEENSESRTLKLCIAGDNNLANRFSILDTKKIRGKNLAIQMLDSDITIGSCDVLFISDSQLTLEEHLQDKPLVIIDGTRSETLLGHLILVQKEQGLAFHVNRANAQKNGISFSSQLLRLAQEIHDEL